MGNVTRTEIISSSVAAPRGHFSHAVRAADTVYVSGLLAFDENSVIIGPDDIAKQTERIFEILGHILCDAGGQLTDTVALTTYVTDIGERGAVNDIRSRVFGDCRPASTLVEVSGLAVAGAVVEIDAIAVISGRLP